MRRHHGGYRWSMFLRQAKSRGIEVSLERDFFLRLIARPCLYCGSQERCGVDRVRSGVCARQRGSMLCHVQLHEGDYEPAALCGACAAGQPWRGHAGAIAIGFGLGFGRV